MSSPFIQATSVQQLRSFLGAAGMPSLPTEGVAEVTGSLVALLDERRDDPSFWDPLAVLVEELVATSEDRLVAAEADVLRGVALDGLLEEMRSVLRGQSDGPAHAYSFLRSLAAPALSLLLLVAMAGCDSPSSSEDTVAAEVVESLPDTSAGDAAASDTYQSDGAVDAMSDETESLSLADYVEASDLPEWLKDDLLDCLSSEYSQGQRDDLVELFETLSPEEIADKLEAIADSPPCYEEPVPVYKGVSFPARPQS